jgi:glutamine synthetase
LDGIEKQTPLPIQATDDPALLPKKVQQQGQMDPLPTSLGQAIEALKNDPVLMESLGETRARAYIAVRTMEWEALKDMSLEDEVKLLAERY